jgi:hypothetical protein
MRTKRSIYDILVEPTLEEIAHYSAGFAGNELGFNERSDVPVQAGDGTDLNQMWTEIQATLALRNSQRNRMIDYLTFRTSDVIDQVSVPSEVDFEEASEYGQPKGITGGVMFNRGYTFKFYDIAVRYTWMFIAEATRAQLENLNNMALSADTRLVFNKVMQTLFTPTNLIGVADSNIPVNVYKFYNGDGEVPPPWKNNTFVGTHTHYSTTQNLATSATLTSATLDAIEDDMIAHGYGQQTGTKLVLWVNRQEFKLIKSWKVTSGNSYDFIPGEGFGGGVLLPMNGGIVGRPNGSALPGEVGTYGPFHVVVEEYIPPGYLVVIAAGGPDNLMNPIGIREHKNPAYQGLKIIPGQRTQYPLIDSFYRRGFGVGVRQRGGGFVVQVTASATYTVPTQYV